MYKNMGKVKRTLEEYAIVATLFERAKIFAAVIAQTG